MIMKIIGDFFMVFTPLFFIIDAIGILPIFMSQTRGMGKIELRKLTNLATLTAGVVAVLFVFFGKLLFKLFGITVDDFRIGGGIVLFLIGIIDLLFSQQEARRAPSVDIGIVPIGIPLILGPGTLTMLMMFSEQVGYIITLLAFGCNLAIVWASFRYADKMISLMGEGVSLAFGKVASLFLIAIAIMMVRVGIANTFPVLVQKTSQIN